MSITNIDLIADSLRELGVINETQTPSAEQAQFGLRRLNQIMAQLATDDLDLGFFPQTLTSDNCPIPNFAELCITCLLALGMASNYGKSVSAELGTVTAAAWDAVLSKIVSQQMPQATVINRPNGAGWSRARSRILTG